MRKIISILLLGGLTALFITFVSAQGKQTSESPKPVQTPSQELLWAWNSIGGKLVTMAEDFPEDKYDFKAQKDERTFAENILHVASDYYSMIGAIKGAPMGPKENEDALRIKYHAKAEIVKLMKQAVADGNQLIKEQGDDGLTREFKYPWGNRMVHVSFGWLGTIEHAGEHYGQLVVYYRINGMIPPASRPKK